MRSHCRSNEGASPRQAGKTIRADMGRPSRPCFWPMHQATTKMKHSKKRVRKKEIECLVLLVHFLLWTLYHESIEHTLLRRRLHPRGRPPDALNPFYNKAGRTIHAPFCFLAGEDGPLFCWGLMYFTKTSVCRPCILGCCLSAAGVCVVGLGRRPADMPPAPRVFLPTSPSRCSLSPFYMCPFKSLDI